MGLVVLVLALLLTSMAACTTKATPTAADTPTATATFTLTPVPTSMPNPTYTPPIVSEGSFAAAANYDAGNYLRSVIAGDVDGDGNLDLAVADFGSGAVGILLGNGDGTFADAVHYYAGDKPASVTTGDFDGDGNLDLAAANFGSHNVSILLGNGDGTFADATHYFVGRRPISITTGDFDGDGNLDLAVANHGSDSVGILHGKGDGTFADAVRYYAGDRPISVMTGDFDGDGNLDLAVANYNGHDVSILLSKSDGTYADAAHYNAGDRPISVMTGDFDDDGNLDLAVANYDSHDVSILFGNGDGTFADAVHYHSGSRPISVTARDTDGDGDLDLAVARYAGVSILLNQGDGTFADAVSYYAGEAPQSVTTADFNRDGHIDLAVANRFSHDVSILAGGATGETSARPVSEADMADTPSFTPGGCSWAPKGTSNWFGLNNIGGVGFADTYVDNYTLGLAKCGEEPSGAANSWCPTCCVLDACGVEPDDLPRETLATYFNRPYYCTAQVYERTVLDPWLAEGGTWHVDATWVPLVCPPLGSCNQKPPCPDDCGCRFPEVPLIAASGPESADLRQRSEELRDQAIVARGVGNLEQAAQLTEQLLANEVRRLLPEIPNTLPLLCPLCAVGVPGVHYGSCAAQWGAFCLRMLNFDSVLREAGAQKLRFRGDDIQAGELNYYFIGMAFGVRGFSWSKTFEAIAVHNSLQRCARTVGLDIGDPNVTAGILKAARAGWDSFSATAN